MEQLDEKFEGRSEGEKWLIILTIAALFGYILYIYLYPYAKDRYDSQLNQKKQLERKIAEDQTFLRSITRNGDRNYKIREYDRQIAERKQRIEGYKKRIALLDQSFLQLSAVLFNKENWARFLDSITDRAHQNGIALDEVRNRYVNDKAAFGHVLELKIFCHGRYQGILSFINDLEQNKLVTDVYKSKIYSDANSSTTRAELDVSVWGVNK